MNASWWQASVAGRLGPALGAVAAIAGTEATFTGVAIVAGGLAAVAVRTPAPAGGDQHDPRRLGPALRHRFVVAGMWLILLPSLGFGAVAVLGALRLDELGASAVAIGAVFLVASGFESVVSPVAGRVADRHGKVWVTRIGLVCATLLTLLLPVAGVAWLFATLVVLASPSYGTLWVPGMALISDGAESVGLNQGFAFAIFNMAWAAAQIGGSAGGAALAQATSDTAVYATLAALCAATLVAMGRRQALPA